MALDPSPILGITLVEPDQTGKFDAINAMISAVEASTQDWVAHDLSASNLSVTAADFTGYHLHKTTGNAISRVLTVPATIRAFIVWNAGSATLTVTVSGGSSDTVVAGKMKQFQSDGVDLVVFAESDVGTAAYTGLGDVDATLAGDGTKRLRVNAGETAIEHVVAGSENPPQIDKTTEYTITSPPAPLIGLTGFVKKRAFRKSLAFIDPESHVETIETALFRKNSQYLVGAGDIAGAEGAITLSSYALGFGGGTASPSARNVIADGTNSFFDLQRKSQLETSSGFDTQAYWVASELAFARGSMAGTGGFYAVFRFGGGDVKEDSKFFVGLGGDTGSITSTWASNTTALGAALGLIKDTTDITWQVIQKVAGSTSFTKTDTGFPSDSMLSDFFELRVFCEPCGVPYYALERLNTGEVFEGQFANTATLPGATVLLYPAMRAQNSPSIIGQTKLYFSRLYFENEVSAI